MHLEMNKANKLANKQKKVNIAIIQNMTSWNLKKDSYSSSIDKQQKLQQILQVNARLNVSISVEITLSISPYKVF
jgi:hypothetical protein